MKQAKIQVSSECNQNSNIYIPLHVSIILKKKKKKWTCKVTSASLLWFTEESLLFRHFILLLKETSHSLIHSQSPSRISDRKNEIHYHLHSHGHKGVVVVGSCTCLQSVAPVGRSILTSEFKFFKCNIFMS